MPPTIWCNNTVATQSMKMLCLFCFFELKSAPSLYLDAAVGKLERRKTINASDYGPLCTLKISIMDHSLATQYRLFSYVT